MMKMEYIRTDIEVVNLPKTDVIVCSVVQSPSSTTVEEIDGTSTN